jgi:predicted acyl esterase
MISHPDEAKPGRNEVMAPTVHYGPVAMWFEKDVPITVRDGTVLYANVFRPHKEGRFPVVISADMYGKDSIHMVQSRTMPKPGPNTLGQFNASDFAAWEAPDPGFWVPNDYVVIKLALRGTSSSQGLIAPLSLMEAQDYYDAIEWAGVQPWSSGKVGTNGVSYLAMTQWRVGQLNPPHLAAMIPWEGVSDIYRDLAFHGGMRDTCFTPFLDAGARRRWPDSDLDPLAGGQEAHPLFDAYWQERTGDLAAIRVPIYVCASWSTQGLHNRGTIEGFKQASSTHKWIEIHGRKEWEVYYAREQLERQKRFFDYFLKGIENDWLDTPRVRYEVRERFYEGRTRFAAAWPLPETRYVPLYLDLAAGALVRAPLPQESFFRYDSGAPNQGGGRLILRVRFEEDTELTGHMKLKLWVAADAADDMDLFVGLKKFDRRGEEMHFPDLNHIENGGVAKGWLRVSHRTLDERRSTAFQPWLSHDRERKLAPGEIVPVEIEILPSSTLFRTGESLELTVQGGDIAVTPKPPLPLVHGRMDVRHADPSNRGGHVIHAGGRYDSHLLVPVVPAAS